MKINFRKSSNRFEDILVEGRKVGQIEYDEGARRFRYSVYLEGRGKIVHQGCDVFNHQEARRAARAAVLAGE